MRISQSVFIQSAVLGLAIVGALALIAQYSQLPLGQTDFWHYRGHVGGLFFLIAIALFPRLTLLISSVPFGGLLWWLGWLFMPRVLVACLATLAYWQQNPILVILAWLVALSGESSEKVILSKRRPKAPFQRPRSTPQSHLSHRDETIEDAEFKEL